MDEDRGWMRIRRGAGQRPRRLKSRHRKRDVGLRRRVGARRSAGAARRSAGDGTRLPRGKLSPLRAQFARGEGRGGGAPPAGVIHPPRRPRSSTSPRGFSGRCEPKRAVGAPAGCPRRCTESGSRVLVGRAPAGCPPIRTRPDRGSRRKTLDESLDRKRSTPRPLLHPVLAGFDRPSFHRGSEATRCRCS